MLFIQRSNPISLLFTMTKLIIIYCGILFSYCNSSASVISLTNSSYMTASLLAEKASLDGGKLAGTTTSTFISEKTLGLCSGFSTEIVSDSNYNQVKKVLSDTTNYTQKHTDTTRVQNVTNDSPIKQSAPITIYPAGYDRNRKPFYGLTQEEKNNQKFKQERTIRTLNTVLLVFGTIFLVIALAIGRK